MTYFTNFLALTHFWGKNASYRKNIIVLIKSFCNSSAFFFIVLQFKQNMLHSVFINFQWCFKQKCWYTSHTLLVQVTQKTTHGNKYITKIFGWPKGRWSHWPGFRTFMDPKRRFECSFGFFGVMCSIIPKNMFKWLQCIWNFLSFDEQCETTCQSTKSHL